jgi:hypothetical protein
MQSRGWFEMQLGSMHFILGEDGEPVAVDLMTWALWLERGGDRVVLQTRVDRRGRVYEQPLRRAVGVNVSTVFLGLDHSFGGGPPVLWETMIFGGPLDQRRQWRYRSKLEALRGHEAAVALAVAVGLHVPRRLKKAIRKPWGRALRPLERRRVARFEARVDATERRLFGERAA